MPLRGFMLAMLVLVGGCRVVRPDAEVGESATLVERRVGTRPGWFDPWLDIPPPEWKGSGVLTRETALEWALRNNRDLRADVEMIGVANADLFQAGLLTNPTINFMVMFPAGGGRSMLRGSGLPLQQLQDLWMIPARQEVARAELQRAIVRVADRAVEVAESVKRVYARLQYTARALELLTQNIQLVEETTGIIQSRQIAGEATQVEVTLSRIRGERLRSERVSMHAEYRRLQRELLMLMGFATADDRWMPTALHELETEVAAPAREADLVVLGALQRLDLRAAEWGVQATQRRIKLMQREGWPMVALGFSIERSASGNENPPGVASNLGRAAAAGAAGALTGMPMSTPGPVPGDQGIGMGEVEWTLGPMIEMEIPIFDQNQAQVAKAIHEYRQSVAGYEARLQEATRAIREARVMHEAAYEQVRLYREEILPEVERNLTLAQESYIGGRESLTIYLQAREDLLTTRLQILEFLRDYELTQAELERAVGGRLDPELLEPPPPPLPSSNESQPTAGEPGASDNTPAASQPVSEIPDELHE